MILVTGGSGLLGATLVALAKTHGRKVVGLYHRHAVSVLGTALLPVDLTQEAEIRRIFEKLKPQSVIHCAAATNVDWCEENPEAAHRINVAASATIAEISSRMNARLLYVSTDSVFNGARGDRAETDTPAPLNVYAQTKLQGEQEVLRCNSFAAVVRTNLYGWNVQNK